ncbi:MAG: PDZ domain-containing protein [Planctomycetota bacterium]
MARKDTSLLGLLSAAGRSTGLATSLALGVTLGLASAANGQVTWIVSGDEEQRVEQLAAQEGEQRTRTRDRVTISMQDQGDDVLIELDNGKPTVTINGRRVTGASVRKLGDVIQIVDDFGRVQRNFDISTPSAPSVATIVERPPVMLGVTLSDPSEIVLEQLGLSDQSVVQIDSILEGLPADRSGLRKFDLVVELEGKRGVTRSEITDALRAKKPGQTLRFTVLRRGTEREVEVRLDAFDAKSLGIARLPSAPPSPPSPAVGGRAIGVFPGGAFGEGGPSEDTKIEGLNRLQGFFGERANEATREALEASLEALRLTEDRLPGEIKGELAEAQAELQRALSELEVLRERPGGIRTFTFGSGQNFVLDNDRLIRVPGAAPSPPAPSGNERAERLDMLTKRLDQLDSRLSQFERNMDRFERLIDRLERQR